MVVAMKLEFIREEESESPEVSFSWTELAAVGQRNLLGPALMGEVAVSSGLGCRLGQWRKDLRLLLRQKSLNLKTSGGQTWPGCS